MMIFISSILVALIILLPVCKKCEIRLKNSLVFAITVGIFTGFSTVLVAKFLLIDSIFLIFAIKLCFLIVFTGIIGLYRFYRDPQRISPCKEGIIISPSDGVIRYIKQVENSLVIGITMTYLDVHIIRSPVKGVVQSIERKGSKFLSLKKESSLLLNTQVHMTIHCSFNVKLILTASRLVRKILIWVRDGGEVNSGSRLGKIVFGSQCDIIIPELPVLNIKVKLNDVVYAGISILAEYDYQKVVSNLLS